MSKKGTLKQFNTPQHIDKNIKLMKISEFKDQFMTLTTDEDGDEKYVFKNLDGDNLNTICKGSVPGGWAKEQIEDGYITHVLVSFDIDTKDGKTQSPRGISMIKVDRKEKNIKIFLLCNAQIHRMRTKNTVTKPSGKNLMKAIIELANFMSFRTITLDALDGVVSYYAYVYDFVPANKYNNRGVPFETELKQLMKISKTLKGEIARKDIGRSLKGHQPYRYKEEDLRVSLPTQEEMEEEGYSGTGEMMKEHWDDEPLPMILDLIKLRKKIKNNNNNNNNDNNNNNNNTAKKKTMRSRSNSKTKKKPRRSRSNSNLKSKTMRSKSNSKSKTMRSRSKTKKRKRRSKSNDL